MPFLHVRSLRPAGPFDAGEAVRAVSREFAAATGVAERHVTVTWQRLEAEHYSHGGRTAVKQPAGSHPVLVELLAPDFNSQERIEQMLEAAARAVAGQAGVGRENVFVDFRPARSGQVLDGGELVRW